MSTSFCSPGNARPVTEVVTWAAGRVAHFYPVFLGDSILGCRTSRAFRDVGTGHDYRFQNHEEDLFFEQDPAFRTPRKMGHAKFEN
jgi:hypothetical protein